MTMIIDGTNGLSDVDGSASTPAIRGTDSNTGIFFPAVDTIAFSEGGVEAMRIDSSSNVGIGTASPLGKIDASWGGRTAGQIPAILVGANSDSTTRSDATQKMGVIGAAHYTNAQSPVGLISSNSYASNNDVYVGGGFAGSNAATTLSFWTAANSTTTQGTERARIDSSGNVFVGTTTNLGKLTVQGTITAKASADESILSISHNGSEAVISASYGSTGSYDPMVFKTSDAERMRIDTSGNLLVACTTSNETSSVGVRLINNGGIRSTRSESTSAASTLDVYSTGVGLYRFYVNMAGTVFATSTTITAISDQRLKENITDIDVGLDAVMALKPRKFDWKTGKGKDKKGDRGWIAQEFEAVFPEMIDTWKDPAPDGEEPYKAVNADLIPILVKAIQEIKAELDSVKAELQTLKGN
jgi:hypothetical protein